MSKIQTVLFLHWTETTEILVRVEKFQAGNPHFFTRGGYSNYTYTVSFSNSTFLPAWVTKNNLEPEILIRILWNRNMLLTDIMRTSGSLLMTFWKIFDGRMKISWNFMKFSSGHRSYPKKSSEVNQIRFNIPSETYYGLITFW